MGGDYADAVRRRWIYNRNFFTFLHYDCDSAHVDSHLMKNRFTRAIRSIIPLMQQTASSRRNILAHLWVILLVCEAQTQFDFTKWMKIPVACLSLKRRTNTPWLVFYWKRDYSWMTKDFKDPDAASGGPRAPGTALSRSGRKIIALCALIRIYFQ